MSETDPPNPARIVPDADVLVVDLLVGASAREAMDLVRSHSWIDFVVTAVLLDDAEAVVADLSDPDLASDWREVVERSAVVVDQPPGDHPALAAAYHGNAAHVLTFDESLTKAEVGVALRSRLATSVKRPDAFVNLFDPESLYEVVVGGEYPGPDRDPRRG